MKFIFSLFFFLKLASIANAQNTENRNLQYFLKNVSHDTSGVNLLLNSSNEISFFNPDTGLILAEKALDIARELHFKKGEVDALNTIGENVSFYRRLPTSSQNTI